MTDQLRIYGDTDERTLEQAWRCLAVDDRSLGVLCADNHLGYGQPVGMAVAYPEHLSPAGVGVDIGCGNKAVRTNVLADDIEVGPIMDEIAARISFGMGRPNNEPVDHPVLDRIGESPLREHRKWKDLAASQLGTVGGGNHYVDLFRDEDGFVWVGVHFGSRGFGHKTAQLFLRGTDGGGDDSPRLLAVDSYEGQAYLGAMELAGDYAHAGRDVVVSKVLEILGAESTYTVHNHHNYAWFENGYWIVRKGCTPAYPGQEGFVGSTMGEDSVILMGTDLSSEENLWSTVHGAGRVMSRTAAKGKTKRRKKWECNNRDCTYSHTDKKQFRCPDHVDAKPRKVWYTEHLSEGAVDWDAEKQSLIESGIERRGGDADEAPAAYKRLSSVLDAMGETIRVTVRLTPIGVAMAGPDIFDPFKD